MAVCASEAFVLRTYPFREADLIVSFFTRDKGKLRGSARSARKPKSKFGSGLERLSLIRMHYSERETRELVTCTSCDLLFSQFPLASDYEASVVLDFFAEVSEHLLPAHEPSDKFFRLLVAVIDHLHAAPAANFWPASHYFAYWAVRLGGFLPNLSALTPDAQALASEIASRPISQLETRTWSRHSAADLRHFLVRTLELHLERRLVTAPLLAGL
jgi:DNA repair protein RecO (recombination protein O)